MRLRGCEVNDVQMPFGASAQQPVNLILSGFVKRRESGVGPLCRWIWPDVMNNRSAEGVMRASYTLMKSFKPEHVTALSVHHHWYSATSEEKGGRENVTDGSKHRSYPLSYGSVTCQTEACLLWAAAAVGGWRTEGLSFCTGGTWNCPSLEFRVCRQMSGKILKTQALAAQSQCNQDKQIRQISERNHSTEGQGVFRVHISKWFELKFQKASPLRESLTRCIAPAGWQIRGS